MIIPDLSRIYRINEATGIIEKYSKIPHQRSKRRSEIAYRWTELPINYDATYPKISLDGKSLFLHRVVAAYLVPNIDFMNKTHVHHIDEDVLNFAPSNLEWVTPDEHRGMHILERQAEARSTGGEDYRNVSIKVKVKDKLSKYKGSLTYSQAINKLLEGK